MYFFDASLAMGQPKGILISTVQRSPKTNGMRDSEALVIAAGMYSIIAPR
jgi:hypothetical protein